MEVHNNLKEFKCLDPEGDTVTLRYGESRDGQQWLSVGGSPWCLKEAGIRNCEAEVAEMVAELRWKRQQIKVMKAM